MLPLDDVRVVDFGWVWAGHICGQILGDFGADVVKIESRRRLDPARQGRPIVGDRPDPEQAPMQHNVARNKRSIALDLARPRGRAIALQLVAVSDIVIENMAPHALRGLGLHYEALRAINPGIIMLSSPIAGQSGPFAELRGYGPTVSTLAGLDSAVGYRGEESLGTNHAYGDPNVGMHAAFAVLAALARRARTGLGEYIDLSMWEAMTAVMGLPLMDLFLTGHVATPSGNDHPYASPYGVFPCLGDDRWLSLVIATDAEWCGLCAALGDPDWAHDPELDTVLGRLRRRDEVNARVAEWTRSVQDQDAAELLQRHGVAASACLPVMDRLADEHLNDRGDFVYVDHPVLGSEPLAGVGIHLSDTPGAVRRRAPFLGEHTTEVLHELLGMPADEIEQDLAAGVLT